MVNVTAGDLDNAITDAEADFSTGTPSVSLVGGKAARQSRKASPRALVHFEEDGFSAEDFPDGLPPYSLLGHVSTSIDPRKNRPRYHVAVVANSGTNAVIPLTQYFVTGNQYHKPGRDIPATLVDSGKIYTFRVSLGRSVTLHAPLGPDLDDDGAVSGRGWGFTALSENLRLQTSDNFDICYAKRELQSPTALVEIVHKTDNLQENESGAFPTVTSRVYVAEVLNPRFTDGTFTHPTQNRRVFRPHPTGRFIYVFEARGKLLEKGGRYAAHNVGSAWMINEQSVWGVSPS